MMWQFFWYIYEGSFIKFCQDHFVFNLTHIWCSLSLSLSHIFLIYPLSFIFIPIFFHIISIHPLFHFFLILSKYFFLEKYPDDHFLKIVTLAQNSYPHFKLRVTFSSYPQLLKRDSLKCNMKYHFLKPSPLQLAACMNFDISIPCFERMRWYLGFAGDESFAARFEYTILWLENSKSFCCIDV